MNSSSSTSPHQGSTKAGAAPETGSNASTRAPKGAAPSSTTNSTPRRSSRPPSKISQATAAPWGDNDLESQFARQESSSEEDNDLESTALLRPSAKSSSPQSPTNTTNTTPTDPEDHHDPTAYKLIQTKGEIELMEILRVGLPPSSTPTSTPTPKGEVQNATVVVNANDPSATAKDANAIVPTSIWSDLRADFLNVFVLLLLYTLQGLPIGLSQTIPLVMTEKKVGFAAQAVFSLVTLPFSCKLLWAPFVDSFYSSSLGKRKSWILPTQLLCGLALLMYSSSIDFWISGDSASSLSDAVDAAVPQVDVFALSTFFIFLYFLMATQDIAVDAWALTMLRSRNVIWAGTINNIGQYAGMYLTNVSYLLLSSPTFCSQYLWFLLPTQINPTTGVVEVVQQGLLDIKTLMTICGLMFIITTLVIVLFKTEDDTHPYDQLADLFWQLQERKRVNGILTVPLSISLAASPNNSSPPSTNHSFSSNDSANNDSKQLPNLRLTRSKSNTASTTLALSDLSSKTLFDQNYPPPANISNVSASIPKKLYPQPLANPNDPSTMVALSNQIYQLAATISNKPLCAISLTKPTLSNDTPTPTCSPLPVLDVISTERRYLAHADDGDADEGLLVTLSRMKSVLTLSNVRLLVFWLLTYRISIAACDSMTELKLISRGLHREQLAYLQSLTAPLTLMVPIYLTSIISTSKMPFTISVMSLVPRICLCFCWVSFVAIFPYLLSHDYSSTIFCLLVVLTLSQHFVALTQMVSGMSFFALVADPRIAGTFITMLHTAANFGAMFSRITSMYLVDLFTVDVCVQGGEHLGNDNKETAETAQQTADQANFVTTIHGTDIKSLYNSKLLHNLQLLSHHPSPTSQDGENQATAEKADQAQDEPQSLFLKSLLAQPNNIQHDTINSLYNNQVSSGESILFNASHKFMSTIRSLLESLHLVSPTTSPLFFHEAYLSPSADLQPQQLTALAPPVRVHDLPQFKSVVADYLRHVAGGNGTKDDNYHRLLSSLNDEQSGALLQNEWDLVSPLLPRALLQAGSDGKAHADASVGPHDLCHQVGGVKSSVVDGYFVEVICCGIFGLVYITFMWPHLKKIDHLPISAWRSRQQV